MKITKAVSVQLNSHSYNQRQNVKTLEEIVAKTPIATMVDKTEMFNNRSMEITEAVLSKQKVYPELGEALGIKKSLPNQSDILLDKCMDLTEAIVSQNKPYLSIALNAKPSEINQLTLK